MADIYIAVEVTLSIAVFVMSYKRNRTRFHRDKAASVGIALVASVFCPVLTLIYWRFVASKPGWQEGVRPGS